MRPGELAKALEPTLLRPNALASEIDDLAALAEREHVAAVVVFPCWVTYVRAKLDGSDVRVCAAIAHPYGGESEAAKIAGATEAVRDGAHDIEVVASLAALANGDFQAVRDELAAIARAVRSVRGGVARAGGARELLPRGSSAAAGRRASSRARGWTARRPRPASARRVRPSMRCGCCARSFRRAAWSRPRAAS